MTRPDGAQAHIGEREQRAERNTRIWHLRLQNWTQQQIADAVGLSQPQVSTILADLIKVRDEDAADTLRAIEVGKLDILEAAMTDVLRRQHLTIQGGKVVRETHVDEDGTERLGEPYLDDGPAMAAVDRLLRIAQRRAALLGLDSPVKLERTSYDYTINGINPDDLR